MKPRFAIDSYSKESFARIIELLGEHEPDMILEAVAAYFTNAATNISQAGYEPHQASQYADALRNIHDIIEAAAFTLNARESSIFGDKP